MTLGHRRRAGRHRRRGTGGYYDETPATETENQGLGPRDPGAGGPAPGRKSRGEEHPTVPYEAATSRTS